MKKKNKSKFASKIKGNNQDSKRKEAAFSYLNLPKDVPIFKNELEHDGRVMLDVMPYTITDKSHPDVNDKVGIKVGDLWYKRPFYIHRNIGVEKEVIICPRSVGKPCPICDYKQKQLNAGVTWEDLRDFNRSLRNLYVIIPIDVNGYKETFTVWDISDYCFQKYLKMEVEEDESYYNFPDLEEGYTLSIRFDEESIGDKKKPFPVGRSIKFKERESYSEEILDDVPNLDDILIIKSYKEIESMFMDLDEDDSPGDVQTNSDDPEETVEPVRSKYKRGGKKEKEEPPEEVEEVEEEPEEVEVEEKPKKKLSRSIKPKKDKTDNKCPHGHAFGKDVNEHVDCEECDVWQECIDKYDEA